MTREITYTLSLSVLQGIVHLLNTRPAAEVRPLLNAIEATCAEQDQAREQQHREALRQQLLAELQPVANGVAA